MDTQFKKNYLLSLAHTPPWTPEDLYVFYFLLNQKLKGKLLEKARPNWLHGNEMRAFQDSYFICFPRRKTFSMGRFQRDAPKVCHALTTHWGEKIATRGHAYRNLKRHLEEAMDWLAPVCKLVPLGKERYRLYASTADDYRSQGWGAIGYAQGDAEWQAIRLRNGGFTVQVERTNDRAGWDAHGSYLASADFEVWANAQAWQFDALRRQPQSARAFAQWCWCQPDSLNPRVYASFLPFNVEGDSFWQKRYSGDSQASALASGSEAS